MKIIIAALLSTLGPAAVAHEMFLKPVAFAAAPGDEVAVDLLTGTFEKSENPVTRDRMADTSISVGGKVSKPGAAQWSDDATTSYLRFTAATPGTHAIGLSSKPSIIKMSAADFEAYLLHDGIADTLAERQRGKMPATPVSERYAKHVRTIVQVGKPLTDDAARPLGYPAEILLLDNPAALKPGATLRFKALYRGEPLANQLVYAGTEGFHGHDAKGGHISKLQMRTAGDGTGTITIDKAGKWYLSFIKMQKSDDPGVDYVSNWSTVTFQID
jgi:uncharacterized GH25 family protein